MTAGGHFGWLKITFDRISRHFRSILFFFKLFHIMAAGGHFGWPKIAFDRISRHFRSICNFYFFDNFFTKWPPTAILDDRNSLSIEFLAILDQSATFYLFYFFHKMAAGVHFGWPKITFDRISRHFRSIPNFFFFDIFFSKWLSAAILDDRKSRLIAFLLDVTLRPHCFLI